MKKRCQVCQHKFEEDYLQDGLCGSCSADEEDYDDNHADNTAPSPEEQEEIQKRILALREAKGEIGGGILPRPVLDKVIPKPKPQPASQKKP